MLLNAAIGWLGLGLPDEARAELERLSPASRSHPDVLEVRWAICANQSCWDEAVGVAEKIIALAPERPSGWLHRAYALRRAPGGGLRHAWDALRPAADRFPEEPIIAYNLACYACQMGQLDEARVWLRRALKTGDRERLKTMALQDKDLEPLRAEIQRF